MVAVMPRELGSIAAGAEEIIVARLTSPRVQGDVVLRGEVAGEGIEQRYPIEVVATTSQGNAFVPRLYAAVAIANLEASMDDAARRESIELSLRFNVASRYTSLLVLESPAMFKAFGLDNRRRAPEWSGDRESEKSETANETPADADVGATSGGLGAPRAAMKASSSKDELRAKERNQSLDGDDGAVDFSEPKKAGRAAPGSAPAPSRAESAANDWAFDRERLEPEPPPSPVLELPPVRQRRMIPMRRVWDRIGSIDSPPRLLDATSPARRATLESLEREQEQSRQALKGLYVDAFLAGELERAAGFADRWSTKDPLDVDALTARADLAAQRGQRDLAIRILGSVVDVRPGDYKAQWRLARLHRWAGRAERGCRHSLAVAQLMLRDAKLVAEAVSCARDVGQSTWVNDLLDALSPDVRDAVKRLDTIRTAGNELSGDFRARAEWGGAEHDLDLVILHPDGYRVSWLGAPTQAVITATDVNSMHREGLALRGTAAGQYAVELVRSSPTSGVVRGSLELYVGNQRRTIPFLLEGDRVRVATAKLRLQSRLVPY
jgi:hypothetical protein